MKRLLSDQSRSCILVLREALMLTIPLHSDVKTVCGHQETKKNLLKHHGESAQYQNKQVRLPDESAFLYD